MLSWLLQTTNLTDHPTQRMIRKVQSFSVTLTGAASGTATIEAVDTTMAVIWWGGNITNATTTASQGYADVTLTNPTTITVTKNSATNNVTVKGYIVEYTNALVRSVQYGSISLGSGVTTNTATITAVSTATATLHYLGQTCNQSTVGSTSNPMTIVLTNSTTVTADRQGSTGTMTVNFCVVNWQPWAIKSIQQRVVTSTSASTSFTDTITSVDMNNTIILYNGAFTSISTPASWMFSLQLTSATAVTLTRTGASGTTKTIKYTVLEFVPGVIFNMQRNITALTSVTSNTTTVPNEKKGLACLNMTNAKTDGGNMSTIMQDVVMSDENTVTAAVNTATTADGPAWESFMWVG